MIQQLAQDRVVRMEVQLISKVTIQYGYVIHQLLHRFLGLPEMVGILT